MLRVGVDGTNREINAAEYGAAPDGYDFLVIGHEGFGQVEAVGPNVTFLRPGDFVVATVRRPGNVGVLLEPMTVAQKGITQAYEIRRRMKSVATEDGGGDGRRHPGTPRNPCPAVTWARGDAFGRTPRPYVNADLLEAIGARYVNTAERTIADAAAESGPFDLTLRAREPHPRDSGRPH